MRHGDEGERALAQRPAAQLGHAHSVTTLSIVFFSVVTTEPGGSWAEMRDFDPSVVVECSTRKPWPSGEYWAPRAKSV